MTSARVIRSRAPLRLGLAGGGTDLSPFCDDFGGAVLNATIDRYAYASLTFIDGDELILHADDLDITERCSRDSVVCDGPLALHRGVYRRVVDEFLGGAGPALAIHTIIDAPPGSGLGSSSALVVALVEATATSGPQSVGNTTCDSRAMVDSGTLTIEASVWP